MNEESHSHLLGKAKFGAIVFALRTIALQFIVLGGNVVLTRLLDPKDFGLFYIVQFIQQFVRTVGDVGFAPSLIRKKEEPTSTELCSVFYFQMAMSILLIVFLWMGAGYAHYWWKDITGNAVWLIRIVSIEVLLASLRLVPHVYIERKLLFGKVASVEILGSVSFYLGASVLAFLGWKTSALITGVILQASILTLGVFLIVPWKPQLHFDWNILKPILRFGAQFQVKNAVGLLNGAITPVFGGYALGKEKVGLITWAQTTGYFPLRLVEILSRVSFPLYCKLQQDEKLLSNVLTKVIQICALGAMLFASIIWGFGPKIIEIIYTPKWLPSLPLLYIFAGAISIGILTPLVNVAFDAKGRPDIIAKFSLYWTTLNWIVVPLVTYFATSKWKMIGFVGGYVVHVFFGNILVIFIMKKLFPHVRIAKTFILLACAAIVTAGLGRWLIFPLIQGPFSLAGAVLVNALCFMSFAYILDKSTLIHLVQFIRGKNLV